MLVIVALYPVLIILFYIYLSAPSFVPTVSVAPSDVTSSSIRFTWNDYNCTELNGEFTFYNGILTKVDQQNGEIAQSFNLNSPSLRQSRLNPCTRYRFKVAVKNDIGLGYYSDPVEVTTSSVGRCYFMKTVVTVDGLTSQP